jgi:hypothetical protein
MLKLRPSLRCCKSRPYICLSSNKRSLFVQEALTHRKRSLQPIVVVPGTITNGFRGLTVRAALNTFRLRLIPRVDRNWSILWRRVRVIPATTHVFSLVYGCGPRSFEGSVRMRTAENENLPMEYSR